LLRYGLFDVVPIAREALVEGLPDAVVVLDMRDRVVALNPAAERLLGQASRTLLGRPATEIRSISALLGSANGEISEAEIRAGQAPGADDRQFDVGRSCLADRRGRPVGRLLVVRDITERVRAMRVEVERAAEPRKLLDAERVRIARELHDRVEQTFFSIGLSVSALLASLPASPAESVCASLAGIRNSAQQGAEDLRAAIFALTHAEVHDFELVQALWQLVREFQKRTGLGADLAEHGAERRAPPEIAEVLHAVAREGLANVERHARASAVVVSLAFEPDAVTLTVQDDGVGASALVLSSLADSATRFGLNGSRERVLRLGGTFSAKPGDDEGFVLRARLPFRGNE
jgi:PAS domain S-box-containing protein